MERWVNPLLFWAVLVKENEQQPNGNVSKLSFILSCSCGGKRTAAYWKGESTLFYSELFLGKRTNSSLMERWVNSLLFSAVLREEDEQQPNGKVSQLSFILSCSWGRGRTAVKWKGNYPSFVLSCSWWRWLTAAEWKGESSRFSSELFLGKRTNSSLMERWVIPLLFWAVLVEENEQQSDGKVNHPSFVLSCSWGWERTVT